MLNPMLVLLLIISLLAGGCAAIQNYPDRSVNLPEDLTTLNEKFALKDCLEKSYSNQTSDADKKSYRNDYINSKILLIDQRFETFQEDLVREGALKDLSADWANLALTGAAAVVPLAQTKTVLSAISTGITGAKGSVDTNLFFKKTIVALITQMKADRASKLTEILKKMDLDINKYPLTAALIDLEEYYKAGTLPQAILSISATAGAKITAEKEAQKQQLITIPLTTEPQRALKVKLTESLINLANTPENLEKIKKAIKEISTLKDDKLTPKEDFDGAKTQLQQYIREMKPEDLGIFSDIFRKAGILP